MMWSFEHEAVSPTGPADVWSVLADLGMWPDWDTSMEWVRLDGPLEPGATVTMKPLGQDPIVSTVAVVEPDRCYADATTFAGVELRFRHTLHPLPTGGTRVVHRLDVVGEDAVAAEVGAAVTEDFPEAMRGLLAAAARHAARTTVAPS